LNKTFLIVFHGQLNNNGKIIDVSDDPCFENPPSWGICRPNIRRAVKRGDTLIFIAKVDNDYFLKGWFQVGDKLDYISALNNYPARQNVIISTKPSKHIAKWRYRNLKKSYINSNGHSNPNFLIDINTANGMFYQSQTDNHEIDNWKCRRIFHCQGKQFERCITCNKCLKNGTSLLSNEYMNYIVADLNHWEDLDNLRIKLDEIIKATNFPTLIMTPKHQHNVLRFDKYKQKFFEYIDERKRYAKNTAL